MRVLVTGATGFVGRATMARLLTAGHQVRATVRQPVGLPVGVEAAMIRDVTSADWPRLVAEIDAVVHLAARVHVMKDRAADPLAEFRRVNRDATRALARACGHIRRFVYMSSIKAVVDEASEQIVDERTVPAPTSAYGISKLEGEAAVAQEAARAGFRWIALRPPLVLGAGAGGNLGRLIRAIRIGVPLPFGSIVNRRSFVYVENLADAIARALENESVDGLALPITDGPPMSTASLVRALARAMNRPARLLPIPPRLLDASARLLGRSELWARLGGNLAIDERVREQLGWIPPVPLSEAMSRTVAVT